MQQVSRRRLSRSYKIILLCLVFGGLVFCQAGSADTVQPAADGPSDDLVNARTLQPGDSGPDVQRLNARLQQLSYLPLGPTSDLYDWSTRAAVFAFQKYVGINDSGVVGPLTEAQLVRAKRPTVSRGGRRAQVDLTKQLVFWVAESGRVERTVSISTGARGYETPRGHFHIYKKSMWSWSRPYKVWMAYASYVVRGVAFHEGDLSTLVDTHGCIHIPQEFAKDFYHWLRVGTPVWIYGRTKKAAPQPASLSDLSGVTRIERRRSRTP